MSAVALEQENKDLIQKLARTQEERAILEEKVRHLESSSSSMAHDLIQQYSSDRRGSASGRISSLKEILVFFINLHRCKYSLCNTTTISSSTESFLRSSFEYFL